MDKNTVYQVVRRLVGHIDAVGSIQHDERSIINLGTLTDVVDMLLLDISRECSKNMGRHEGSMSEIGMAAKKAIDCFAESIGAADEIDRLRAEVEALREDKAMLEQIRRNVRRVEQSSDMSVTVTMSSCRMAGELIQAIDAAREDA